MRNVAMLAIVVACCFGVLSAAKPMEALGHYNVVLVHGAAPEGKGFLEKCGNSISSAWNTWNDYVVYQGDTLQNQKVSWKLGDAVGMLGNYEDNGDKKLTYWLDSAIFEDTVTYGSDYIYIQRSFVNPAASPAHNAHEIGDRTWKGNNKCSVRRSLFEEAQEVRAGGQDSLLNRRADSVNFSYRAIPSRNILIGHSMGGVVAREYTQNSDYYHGDVDKVITLDSPHEGTGALNMQLDMVDGVRATAEGVNSSFLMEGM